MAYVVKATDSDTWIVMRGDRAELYTTDHKEALDFAFMLNADRQDLYGRY